MIAEPIGIEFTKLACKACGHSEVADVWARAEWYALDTSKNCTLCRSITRDGNWPVETTLAKFGLVRETFGSETKYVSCPECATTYWYSFHEWLQDWQSETSFAFTRLDIAQTLESLPAEARAGFAQRVSSLIAELENDLASEDKYPRTEAAWKLARYYNSQKDWSKLQRLLAHPDADVFAEAFLQSFRQKDENSDPEPPPAFGPQTLPADVAGPAMARGAECNHTEVKQLATAGLCAAALENGDTAAVVRILKSKDGDTVDHALWYLTYKAQVLNVQPLRKLLMECVKTGTRFRATCALKILRRGRNDGADPVPPFKFIVNCLKHKKKEIRTEAVEQLCSWATSKEERHAALKILVRLLGNKQLNYYSLEQLKNQAEYGAKDIAIVIPEIIAYVQKKRNRWETAMEILRYASESRLDISAIYPFIAKGIATGDRRVIASSAVIVDHILRKKTDMSALEKDLTTGLTKMHADYYGEQLVRLLVGIYRRRRDKVALDSLIKHSNKDIALFAGAAIRQPYSASR